MPLAEFVDMNKTRFVWEEYSHQIFNQSILKVNGILYTILVDLLLLEKGILIKMIEWNI